jgi:hypothetical protein
MRMPRKKKTGEMLGDISLKSFQDRSQEIVVSEVFCKSIHFTEGHMGC